MSGLLSTGDIIVGQFNMILKKSISNTPNLEITNLRLILAQLSLNMYVFLSVQLF